MSYIVDDLRDEIERLQKRVAELEAAPTTCPKCKAACASFELSCLECRSKYGVRSWLSR